VEWRADQLGSTVSGRSLDDDDVDSASECGGIDWREVPVVLVGRTDSIDGAANVVHAIALSLSLGKQEDRNPKH
jgi:hypothetical protein